MLTITEIIAQELKVNHNQVTATVALMDEGATVPFIARYRKEVTGGLTDTQLRDLVERLTYLRELEARRETIIKSIEEQNLLTDELKQQILTCDNKAKLEDLYLPFKPKRRTKASIAKEAGLEPLAMSLLADPTQDPNVLAQNYLNPDVQINDVAAALDGARQILMEHFALDAELSALLREKVWEEAFLMSAVVPGKEQEGNKFTDYFAYQERLKTVPSHRALAVFRGQREGILRVSIQFPTDLQQDECLQLIQKQFGVAPQQRLADDWLVQTVYLTWRVKLFTKFEVELMMRLREVGEKAAIDVFSKNLKDLLMAAPAGGFVTMGLDPGLRTGVKVVVVDATGKLLDHSTIYPHVPRNEWKKSLGTLGQLCQKHKVKLVSIGNGTASRETDKLVTELQKALPELKLTKLVVSEAGASVYSASALASNEFPDLDVTFRGAVSIARRLQDPLAELVKIEPKSIGVGQYQHDVNQILLNKCLEAVVEDCVNAVGVDLNRASVALLARVAGLNQTLAQNIVDYRDLHGAFARRDQLREVPRFGAKTYEQAVGFLRIVDGENPLDASGVHPEAYPLIEHIIVKTNKTIRDMIGQKEFLRSLPLSEFVSDQFGLPTVQDIIQELEKPGRDPRPEFKTAQFKEGVHELSDLQKEMQLEGVVTNITDFGAFVDIGVHEDGLVHKSEMAGRFVRDPREIVSVGQIVMVKVLEVDIPRKRISLTMRLQPDAQKPVREQRPAAAQPRSQQQPQRRPDHKRPDQRHATPHAQSKPEKSSSSLFAEALKQAMKQ